MWDSLIFWIRYKLHAFKHCRRVFTKSNSMQARLQKTVEEAERNAHQRTQREDMIRLGKLLDQACQEVGNEKFKTEN